jgi:hypothetical protein
MKAGDRVRLIAIPPGVKDGEKLQTRALFEECLGKGFAIVAVEAVDGLPHPMVRLDVGNILGEPAYLETIWVEPKYLQLEQQK